MAKKNIYSNFSTLVNCVIIRRKKNCIMIKVDEKSLFVVWLSIEVEKSARYKVRMRKANKSNYLLCVCDENMRCES